MAENPAMVVGFHQVPEGETAVRAAVFETRACGELTLRVTAGPNPPFELHLPADGVLHVPQKPQIRQIGRIWFRFTAGTAGVPVPSSDITIHCDQTGEDFIFHLQADVIPKPKVAVLMTLDQSGSMDELAGIDTTTKRIDVLHSAATSFVQLVQDQNGVGVVSFDNVAHPRFTVTQFTGGAFDPARGAATTAVQAIQPGGSTSIGSGLQLARDALAPATGYDRKAILVFTDGLENTEPWISDVTIDDRTFAIGLGTAQEVSVGALTALANHTQGYLLLSGALSPSIDDYFRLTKYFLQVLAGMTNNDIVTDPEGFISPGAVLRVPFQLNEADIDATVVLLGDVAGLRFAVETPAGEIMGPPDTAAAGAIFRATSRMDYYRFNLPLTLGGDPAQPGTWHALLAVGRKRGESADHGQGAPLRYSLSVHAFSNLRMRARMSQSSMEPGARLTLHAVLTEYGVAVDHRARVDVDVDRPDGTAGTIGLTEIEPGIFESELVAALEGVYRFRVRAAGGTMRGEPFTREQLLSAAVVRGGDRPPPKSDPRVDEGRRALCELLECLLAQDRLGRLLEHRGVDVVRVRQCLEDWCRRRTGPLPEQELRASEGGPGRRPETPETVELTDRMIATVAEILHQAERERGDGPEPWAD
jgi:von Willebrand factor type A domain